MCDNVEGKIISLFGSLVKFSTKCKFILVFWDFFLDISILIFRFLEIIEILVL